MKMAVVGVAANVMQMAHSVHRSRCMRAGGSLLHQDGSSTVDPHMMGSVHSVSPAYVEMVTEINTEVANIASMSTLGFVISSSG